MSTSILPAVLPNTKSLGSNFLASYSLCLFISALETGVIVVCFSRFLTRRAFAESWAIKLLVCFVTFISLFQTGATFATWWKMFVIDFGNWGAVSVPAWPHKIEAGLTTLLSVPVQLFLTWRCWHIMKRRWFIALPLVLLITGTLITTIYVVRILFLIQFASPATKTLELHAFFSSFTSCLTFSVVIDLSLASILLVFLLRSRSTVLTGRYYKVLSELIRITWECAIPPLACAIAALVLCGHGAPLVSYWTVMVQTICGKLYVISLFVTLEARANLAELANFPTLSNTMRPDGTWAVAQNEYDQSDSVRDSQPSVRSSVAYKVDDSANKEGTLGV